MEQAKLAEILRLHFLWLHGSTEGERANLVDANPGVNLDFSAWPF